MWLYKRNHKPQRKTTHTPHFFVPKSKETFLTNRGLFETVIFAINKRCLRAKGVLVYAMARKRYPISEYGL